MTVRIIGRIQSPLGTLASEGLGTLIARVSRRAMADAGFGTEETDGIRLRNPNVGFVPRITSLSLLSVGSAVADYSGITGEKR